MQNSKRIHTASFYFYCYNILLYLLIGSQLVYLFGHQTIVLLLISVFFFAMSFLHTSHGTQSHNLSRSLFQCALLLLGQCATVFFTESPIIFTLGYICCFSAIGLSLSNPLSHIGCQYIASRALFNSLMPFFGILAGIYSFKHFDPASSYIFLSIPAFLFACLCLYNTPNLPKQTHSPAISNYASLFWLNIGWVWTTTCIYFFQEGRFLDPSHQITFILGLLFAYRLSYSPSLSDWKTNSSAYWILAHTGLFFCLPTDDAPLTVLNAISGFVFACASAKILFSSLARTYPLQDDRFSYTNLAIFLLALVIYPLFIDQVFLLTICALTLVIVNAYITDASCSLLATVFGCLQFILHRIGVRYSGLEHLSYKKNQRVILVSNHSCFLDVPLISSLFDEVLAYPIYPFWLDLWAIRVLGGRLGHMYAMKPSQSSSLTNVIHAIRKGQKCLIFPEGRLSDTGNLMKIFEGTVILAEHAKADLQPVIINGGMNLTCSRNDFRHIKSFFTPISVTFGPCLPIPETDLRGKSKRKFVKHVIFKRLTETYLSSYADVTLPEMLNDSMRRFGSKRLVIRNNDYLNDMTYHQFIQKAKLIALRLKEHQVQPRSILAISINHGADCAALYFACFILEIIVLPIDRDIHSKSFAQLCDTLAIHSIVVDSNYWPHTSHDQHYASMEKNHITSIRYASLTQPRTYAEKFALSLQPLKHSQSKPNSIPAVLFYNTQTAESTLLSHQNLCQQAYQLQISCDFQGKDIVFNSVGLNHCYGLVMGLLHPIVSGTELFLTTSDFNPHSTTESIYETQSTVFISNLETLKATAPANIDSFDTLRLRCIFSDGTPSKTLRNQWEKNAKTYLFSVWTAPNNSGILACNTPYYHDASSLGQLLPKTTISGDQMTITSIQGPICPHFTYKKTPIPYRKSSKNSVDLPFSVTMDSQGFLFAHQEETSI